MRFGIADLAADSYGVEEGMDTQIFQYGIKAGIKIGYEAEFEPVATKHFKDFSRFRKQHPASRISKQIVDFLEEPVEVFDHSHIGKDAEHDFFPPRFLRGGVQRARMGEVLFKGFLNF